MDSKRILQRRLAAWLGTKPKVEHAHQQEQQVALKHQIAQEHSTQLQQTTEMVFPYDEKNPSYDCAGFQNAVWNGEIKLPESIRNKYAVFKFLDNGTYTDREHNSLKQSLGSDLEEIWLNWVGHVLPKNSSKEEPFFYNRKELGKTILEFPDVTSHRVDNLPLTKIKQSAIYELLEHLDRSQHGISYEHPPQGFILEGSTLNYRKNLFIPAHQVRVEESYEDKKSELGPDISTLEGIEKEWWEELFKIHQLKNPEDRNHAELSRAFKAFLAYIKQHDLILPNPAFANPEFNNIKSLPQALSNIVALLKNCSKKNRQHQLNVVPLLDLSNTGAIRAIRQRPHKTNRYSYQRCQFVLPRMDCRESEFGKYHGYLTFQGKEVENLENDYSSKRIVNIYRATLLYYKIRTILKPTRRVEEIGLDSAKKTFWRYIAHKDSPPLDFYLGRKHSNKGAVARIEEFKDEEIKANLYTLLAELTTEPGLVRDVSTAKMLNYWNNLCDLIQVMAVDREDTMKFFEILYQLKAIPPLDLLNKIIVLCTKWARTLSLEKIKLIPRSFERLANLLLFLPDPSILYHGMRHHRQEQKMDDPFLNVEHSLFLDYLTKFEAIQECGKNDKKNNAVSLLFQSHSTFNLSMDEIKACYKHAQAPVDIKNKPAYLDFQESCFNLINEMIVRDQKPLNSEDLKKLLTSINELFNNPDNYNDKMIAFINSLEAQFPRYFEDNFLDDKKKYYQNAIHSEVQSSINFEFAAYPQSYRIVVRNLVSLYKGVLGQQHILVQVLKQLTDTCFQYHLNLIDCLEAIHAYELTQSNKRDIMDAIRLFTLVNHEKNLAPLEALVYRPHVKESPNLIQKSLMLYQNICPWLQLNQDQLSETSSFTPAINLVLAVPHEEWQKEVNIDDIDPKCDRLVKELTGVLDGRPQDLIDKIDELLETVYCQDKTLLQARVELAATLGPIEEKEKKDKNPKERLWQYAEKIANSTIIDSKEWRDYLSIIPDPDKKKLASEKTEVKKTPDMIKKELGEWIKKHPQTKKQWHYFILNYYQRIYQLIDDQPDIKTDLLQYISHFANKYQPKKAADKKTSYAEKLNTQLRHLECAAHHFKKNPKILRDILYHGHHMEGPEDLISFIKIIESNHEEDKTWLYKLLAKLIGEISVTNDGPHKRYVLTVESFQKLSDEYKNNKLIKPAILKWYKHPPYQDLSIVLSPCSNTEHKEPDKLMLKNHDVFDAAPFKSDPLNKFNLTEVKKQIKKFSNHPIFPNEILNELENKIDFYRKKSTSKKIALLRQLKISLEEAKGAVTPLQVADLTALLTELMFATSNQEFNSTQVLALYSQLMHGTTAIHQIATGAGKTRIAMALCAGKWILGENPDFATETMKLAEEAYYSTKPFFRACGINIVLLDANTPLKDYFPPKSTKQSQDNRIIAFSAREELGLFHNRVKSEDHSFPDKEKRVLIADEGDTFYNDPSRLHLNLARVTDGPDLDFRWAYDFIYTFTQEDNFFSFYNNADDLRQVYNELIKYIKKQNIASTLKDKFEKFAKVHENMLEIWLNAALTAQKLEEGLNFDADLAQDLPMLTDAGTRVASTALVKIKNLISNGSIYSDAVQQFLHVRLNFERDAERAAPTGKKISKTPYYVQPLSDVTFSSTTASLLKHHDRYDYFLGLTGSSGSEFVREEMQQRYPGLEFVDVPDHKPHARTELSTFLVKNQKEKRAVFALHHQATVEEGRPNITICKDDIQSKKIETVLRQTKVGTVQRLDGTLQKYEEIVEASGNRSTTTVGTKLMGRGVNTKLKATANQIKGTAVAIGCVQDTCDDIQTRGRAARYGKPGTVQKFLSLDELKKEFLLTGDLSSPNLIDLFLDRERYIKRLQFKLDQKEQRVRCTYTAISHFIDTIYADFFKKRRELAKTRHGLNIEALWVTFTKKLNEIILTPAYDTINELLKDDHFTPDKVTETIDTIVSIVNELCVHSKESYDTFLKDKFAIEIQPEETLATKDEKKQDVPLLKQQLCLTTLELDVPAVQKTYAEYDPAHAGQNVVYHELFAESRWAYKQWRKNALSFFGLLSELFYSTQHQKAAANGTGLSNPEQRARATNMRGRWANTCAYLKGDLNNEWQDYEAAFIKLDAYAKLLPPEKNDKKTAVEAVLTAVKQKSQKIDGKKDLEQLTQVLRGTHDFMKQKISSVDYQKIHDSLQQDKSWLQIKNAMKVVAGILLLSGCIAAILSSHGLATPIAIHGIKLSLNLIMGSVGALLVSGTGLVGHGLFNDQARSIIPVLSSIKQVQTIKNQ